MRELSIFIDESGDAGRVSKYYLVALVFHEQDTDIGEELGRYGRSMQDRGLAAVPFHFGPLLNGHDDYEWETLEDRRKRLASFAIMCNALPITYASFSYEKRGALASPQKLSGRIEKDVTAFLEGHLDWLQSFNEVKIYYDGGQSAVTQAIHGSIEKVVSKQAAVYRDASPARYRLSQVADYICGIELTSIKFERGEETKTDVEFFDGTRSFKKNYLRKLRKKRL